MTSLCGQFHTHMLCKNPIKIITDVDKPGKIPIMSPLSAEETGADTFHAFQSLMQSSTC